MDDNARRCALPGCAVWLEDIPGRPPRRYCTAAHRAAARQARRASMQLEQHSRLAETLPWLREPEDEPEPVPVDQRPAAPHPAAVTPEIPRPRSRGSLTLASLRRRSPRWGTTLTHRRRAVAVLGVAGILAGGYAVTASAPVERPTAAADQGAGLAPDDWAARAAITLTSLDEQLDVIAQTEAAWNSLPENRRSGELPASMKALKARQLLLEGRKSALQLQLQDYRSLDRTEAELEESELNLRSVERVLENQPPESQRSPQEATTAAALDELRDFRLRQRNNKLGELDGLQHNVETATRAPLPDDGQATTEVSNRVMDGIERDGSGKDPAGTPVPPRPELVGGREEKAGQERQDTATSAPPDPRGPRDESGERRDDPEARADGGPNTDERGPVGKVVGAVGGVVTGDDGSPEPAPAPAEPQADGGHHGDNETGQEGDHGQGRDGHRGGLISKVGDVVAGGGGGSDRKAADTAERTRPEQVSPQKSAPKTAASDGGVLGSVGDQVDGGTGDGRASQGGDGKPDAQPVIYNEPPASVRPASAAEEPKAVDDGGSPRATPAQSRRTVPAPAPVATPGTDMARQVAAGVPGGQWAAPMMEAAITEAGRSAAAKNEGSGASAPSRATPAPGGGEGDNAIQNAPARASDPPAGSTWGTTPSGGGADSGPARTTPATSAPARSAPAEAAPVAPRAAALSPARSSPVRSSPVRSSPVRSSPVRSSPVRSSPVRSSPAHDSGATPSNSTITRTGDTSTYRSTDGSGTSTVTTSPDGYSATRESNDGSAPRTVTSEPTAGGGSASDSADSTAAAPDFADAVA